MILRIKNKDNRTSSSVTRVQQASPIRYKYPNNYLNLHKTIKDKGHF